MKKVQRTPLHFRMFARISRFWADERGQAMTEFVILTAVMTVVAAYLYYPDNNLFVGIRKLFDKHALVVGLPGP